jgi:hypothetical protein
MKAAMVLGITVLVSLVTFFQWPKMDRNQRKEKTSYIALAILGWVLSILLVFFPEMDGPTEMLNKLFKPFGQMLNIR